MHVHTLTHKHTQVNTYSNAWENLTFWDFVIQVVPLLPACLFSSTALTSVSLWPSVKTEQAAATCSLHPIAGAYAVLYVHVTMTQKKDPRIRRDPLASTLSSSRPFHYLAFIQTSFVCGSCTASMRCTGRRNDQQLSWPLTVIKRACTQKHCLHLSQIISHRGRGRMEDKAS